MIAADSVIATRVPYAVYFDEAIYAREQARIFRGPHWTYVALESELPEPRDFKTSFLGRHADRGDARGDWDAARVRQQMCASRCHGLPGAAGQQGDAPMRVSPVEL
jgi:hypothetical protein